MPIEIRQMIVKARVDPKERPAPGQSPARKDDCDCTTSITPDDLARLLKDREER